MFATGTNAWIAHLDQNCSDCPGPALIRITLNLFAAFSAGPAGAAHPSTANYDEISGRKQPATTATTTATPPTTQRRVTPTTEEPAPSTTAKPTTTTTPTTAPPCSTTTEAPTTTILPKP